MANIPKEHKLSDKDVKVLNAVRWREEDRLFGKIKTRNTYKVVIDDEKIKQLFEGGIENYNKKIIELGHEIADKILQAEAEAEFEAIREMIKNEL